MAGNETGMAVLRILLVVLLLVAVASAVVGPLERHRLWGRHVRPGSERPSARGERLLKVRDVGLVVLVLAGVAATWLVPRWTDRVTEEELEAGVEDALVLVDTAELGSFEPLDVLLDVLLGTRIGVTSGSAVADGLPSSDPAARATWIEVGPPGPGNSTFGSPDPDGPLVCVVISRDEPVPLVERGPCELEMFDRLGE